MNIMVKPNQMHLRIRFELLEKYLGEWIDHRVYCELNGLKFSFQSFEEWVKNIPGKVLLVTLF